MSRVAAAINRHVRDRAGNACEYCHMPQAAYAQRLQIEHVVARQHHGTDDEANLALACVECNQRKGPNLSGIDPDTRRVETLFHPRRDRWGEHFRYAGPRLAGLTATGRATLDVLGINHPASVAAREDLIAAGLFDPTT